MGEYENLLSKILEFDIDRGEWDDSKDKELPYLEHALDESLEDHTPPRQRT
jgi:hypothetical protein